MINSFNLEGHNALITGAAGLLGRQHAIALLGAGCKVILTDISKTSLESCRADLLEQFPQGKIKYCTMDVSLENSILETYNSLLKENIQIDILINNAALDPKVSSNSTNKQLTRLENFSLESWEKEISVGLTGAFLCSKIFGEHMFRHSIKGSIVNIASDLSVISPYQSLYEIDGLPRDQQPVKPVTYSVIKTGLIGLTRYLATYWSESGIRCNALSPGGIYNNQPEDFVENVSKQIPLGRMANKNEYQSAILFLCSSASSYMTGQNLIIDGGRSVW